jgi:hypothetical protein
MLSKESQEFMDKYDARIARGNIEERWRELHSEWEKAASKCFEFYRQYLRTLGKTQTYEEWHELAYKDHAALMEKLGWESQLEDIRALWRKADDEVQRLKARNEL